jgi:CRP/FNR family transcriptional regulator, cyclic AMP receptor protein
MSDVTIDLQQHPFAVGLSPEHCARLGALGRREEYSAGTILFPEGDERQEFFLLLAGCVALETIAQAQTVRVDTLEPGTAFGWSAVLLGRGKHFQARALETVDALVFPGLEVLAACRADKAFGFEILYRLMDIVSRRLQAARVKVFDSYWMVSRRSGA